MAPDGWAVEVEGVRRTFAPKKRPEVVALADVSLRVGVAEVHGLLGPNGAGKTTLVKILSTVLLPTSGTARVMGHDVVDETAAVRPLIGIVLGGDRGLYSRLTARQNLAYWAALYRLAPAQGRARADELLERVGLADRADDRVQGYSRGMRQRLHLARGLLNDPPVLFLDEPSTGMDPVAAHDFRTIVRELKAEGRTVFLTTHDMAEAEAVCDRVTLIDKGRVLATESPSALSLLMSRYERIECVGAAAAVTSPLVRLADAGRRDGSIVFQRLTGRWPIGAPSGRAASAPDRATSRLVPCGREDLHPPEGGRHAHHAPAPQA